MMAPLERSIRRTRLIVGIATSISVAALVIAVFVLVRQSNDRALREADVNAQAVSQVSACNQRVESTPKVITILRVIELLANDSITTKTQSNKVREPGDPLIAVTKRSLDRLIPARGALAAYIQQTLETAPTKKDCADLARSLHVTTKGAP